MKVRLPTLIADNISGRHIQAEVSADHSHDLDIAVVDTVLRLLSRGKDVPIPDDKIRPFLSGESVLHQLLQGGLIFGKKSIQHVDSELSLLLRK